MYCTKKINMIITLEISYYPLADNYSNIVDDFISKISNKNITIEIGKMSTIMIGEYDEIIGVLTNSMKELMIEYPSIFNLKISNSCPIN